MFPSFSRDGRSIVYTTWDDEKFGSIRVVPATGGEGQVVSTQPGFYREPVFSPDGRFIVYRAGGGGYLLPGQWGHEQGLYVIGRDGGKPRRLVKEGEQPHFGAALGPGVLPVGGGGREGGQARAAQHRPGRERAAHAPHQLRGGGLPRLAGRAVGGVPGDLQRVRDAAAARRQAGGGEQGQQGAAGGEGVAGTRASTCTGPGTRSGCTGRWGPSCSRASCARRSASWRARRRSCPRRRRRA